MKFGNATFTSYKLLIEIANGGDTLKMNYEWAEYLLAQFHKNEWLTPM